MAIKGILWGILFGITALILIAIPSYLLFTFWDALNNIQDLEGNPIYTYSLFMIFVYTISILTSLIYIAAMMRAFIQRNSDDMGIPKGVKGFGLVLTSATLALFVIWYLIFNEIAIFSLKPV